MNGTASQDITTTDASVADIVTMTTVLVSSDLNSSVADTATWHRRRPVHDWTRIQELTGNSHEYQAVAVICYQFRKRRTAMVELQTKEIRITSVLQFRSIIYGDIRCLLAIAKPKHA